MKLTNNRPHAIKTLKRIAKISEISEISEIYKINKTAICFLLLFLTSPLLQAKKMTNEIKDLLRFQKAYPEYIQSISSQNMVWRDGTVMPVDDGRHDKTVQERLESPSLLDQVKDINYDKGIPADSNHFNPEQDPGRIRYLPFFLKMYGDSKEKVASNCVTIYWMPLYFGDKYPLKVTTVNGVNEKLIQISNELEMLVAAHPKYLPFLDVPGGTFEWRVIANTNRLSPHSFGMTIDINFALTNYWQWDLEKNGQPISEDTPLIYRNDVPWEIIPIFENHGFIWGGKWHHYDSQHFEYRPELLINPMPKLG
jgi:hypothetical protein